MKNPLFFFPLFLCLSLAFGQDFTLLQAPAETGIALRWFPGSFGGWNAHLTTGYYLERAIGTRPYERLMGTPIRASLTADSAAGELLQQVVAYRDSINLLRAQPAGPRLLAGIYRAFLRGVAVTPGGIESSGLYFLDQTATPGTRYRYRLLTAAGQTLAETNSFVVGNSQLPTLQSKAREEIVEWSWSYEQAPANFQAYRLERADAAGIFRPVTEGWQFPVTYFPAGRDTFRVLDTVPTLGQTYTYRLVGITAFGATISGEVVRYAAKDQTPPDRPKNFTVTAAEQAARVTLSWETNDASGDLAGYHVYRSRFPDSAYVRLNARAFPKQQQRFVDEDIIRTGEYYYKLVAVDKTGNERWSFRRSAVFPDKTPPAVPAGLEFTIAKDGSVDLHWSANQEPDLRGYQLAVARYADNEFVPVTSLPITTTRFRDTLALNFVNREIYYSVAALDQRGNLSAYSEPVLGLLPDTIAPARPYLQQLKRRGDTLTVRWDSLADSDVAYVDILVRRSSATQWLAPVRSEQLDGYERYGIDTLAGDWVYAIRAVDAAGNRSSPSNERLLREVKSKEMARPGKLAFQQISTTELLLDWTYPLKKAPVSFLVFRLPAGGKAPVLTGRTRERKLQLILPADGEDYAFFVLAQDDANGQYSAPSEQVRIRR